MALVAPLGVGQLVFFTLLVIVSYLYNGGELALDGAIDPASLTPPTVRARAGGEPFDSGADGNGTVAAAELAAPNGTAGLEHAAGSGL